MCGTSQCPEASDGETGRRLCDRITEHITGKDKMSLVYNHLQNTGHVANDDNFKILFKSKNKHQITIAEALIIAWTKPSINRRINTIPLWTFKQ